MFGPASDSIRVPAYFLPLPNRELELARVFARPGVKDVRHPP
jgi:hypothetical protein